MIVDLNPGREPSPGLYALDLVTGEVAWASVPRAEACAGKRGCFSSNSAGATAIDGVVFAGGLDGVIPGTFDRGRDRDLGVRHDSSGRDGRG